jgi:hypothetical protein
VWLLIVTGLLFGGCAVAVIGAASQMDTTSPAAAEAPAGEAPADKAPAEAPAGPETKAGLNQPARDGKFEFTVTKVACGRRTVGTNQFT